MVAIHALQLEPEEREPSRQRYEARSGCELSRPAPALVRPLADTRPRPVATADQFRRRRLVVLLAAAAVVVFGVAAARTLLTEEPSEVPVRPLSSVDQNGVYVVQPGDTLWSIAERLAPDEDPRPLVAELRQRHGEVELEVGDRIELGDGPEPAG